MIATRKLSILHFISDKIPIQAELAILPKEREKGLMYRDELKPGTGMLFVFKSANTPKILDEKYENSFGYWVFFFRRSS